MKTTKIHRNAHAFAVLSVFTAGFVAGSVGGKDYNSYADNGATPSRVRVLDDSRSVAEKPAPSVSTQQNHEVATHQVTPGETLQHISAKYYGTTKLWSKLYEVNRGKLADPTALSVGMKISLFSHPKLKTIGYDMGNEQLGRLGFISNAVISNPRQPRTPQAEATSGMRKNSLQVVSKKQHPTIHHGLGETYDAIEAEPMESLPPRTVSVQGPVETKYAVPAKTKHTVNYGSDETELPATASGAKESRSPSSIGPPPVKSETIERFNEIEL